MRTVADQTTEAPDPATLAPTRLIDSDHPAVLAYALAHALGCDDRERAVALYEAVRDGFRYDPYHCDLSPHGMRASTVLASGHGYYPNLRVGAAAASGADSLADVDAEMRR